VLQCVAVSSSSATFTPPSPTHTHIYVAVCCSVLQCVAACCSVSISRHLPQPLPSISHSHAHICCSMLQCVEVWCSVLQCVAVCLYPINSRNLYPSISHSTLHYTRHYISHITSCEIQFDGEWFHTSHVFRMQTCEISFQASHYAKCDAKSNVTETRRHHISHTSHFTHITFCDMRFFGMWFRTWHYAECDCVKCDLTYHIFQSFLWKSDIKCDGNAMASHHCTTLLQHTATHATSLCNTLRYTWNVTSNATIKRWHHIAQALSLTLLPHIYSRMRFSILHPNDHITNLLPRPPSTRLDSDVLRSYHVLRSCHERSPSPAFHTSRIGSLVTQ